MIDLHICKTFGKNATHFLQEPWLSWRLADDDDDDDVNVEGLVLFMLWSMPVCSYSV